MITYNVKIIVKRKNVENGFVFFYEESFGEKIFTELLNVFDSKRRISLPYDINGNTGIFCSDDVSSIILENPNIGQRAKELRTYEPSGIHCSDLKENEDSRSLDLSERTGKPI
jgi:hypothetical protein